jgi:hypothetical protein
MTAGVLQHACDCVDFEDIFASCVLTKLLVGEDILEYLPIGCVAAIDLRKV